MKRITALLLCAAFVLLSSPFALAQDIILKEDFNGLKIAAMPQGDWNVGGLDAEKSKISIMEKTPGSKDLCLEVVDDDTKQSAVVASNFAVQSTDFTISFDYLFEKGSQPATVTILKDGVWPPAITAMFTGNLDVFDGSAAAKIKAAITLNAWHNVVFYMHPATSTFDVYFDRELIREGTKFRNEQLKEIDRIQLGIATIGSASRALYDNIEITKGLKKFDVVAPTKDATAGGTGAPIDISGLDKPKEISSYSDLLKSTYQTIGDSLVLMLGEDNALLHGTDVFVDENREILPFTENDRTLLPVRFITESFGAAVTFEESAKRVGIKMGDKNIEMVIGSDIVKVNGAERKIDVPANTVFDRTFIPLRALAEAADKKVFWDEKGLIVISDTEKQLSGDMVDLLISLIQNGKERSSKMSYASTFYSTRWFREDGGMNPWTGKPDPASPYEGSINVARQMMVSGDVWTYFKTPNLKGTEPKAMADTGMSVQGAINGVLDPNQVSKEIYEKARNLTIEGNIITPSWMASTKNAGGAALNEMFYQHMKSLAFSIIDKGIYSIQCDDWAIDAFATSYGYAGGFYPENMVYFKEYVKRNATAEQIKQFGIENIETFNYKTYLEQKHGIKTTNEYMAKRASIPLDKLFVECAEEVTINFHKRLMKDLNEYAKRPITYSVNINVLTGLTQNEAFINDAIDFQLGEAPDGSYSPRNIAVWSSANCGKVSSIMSPIPKTVSGVKFGLGAAYAFGQYLLFPWDTYVDWDAPRYFGKPADYAKEYHFIRQYEALFKNYEIPAKVGILAKRDEMVKASFVTAVSTLFEANVPYKCLVSSEKMPEMKIKPSDFEGLELLYAYTKVENFTKQEQEMIRQSGIRVVEAGEIEKELAALGFATINDPEVFALLRQKAGGDKVIHVLNQSIAPKAQLEMTIADAYMGKAFTYYRPGFDPMPLVATGNKVALPTTEFWGILCISDKEMAQGGYCVQNLGAPSAYGKATLEGEQWLIESKGQGTNVATSGDNGSFDQATYIYKNAQKSSATTDSGVAYVTQNSGGFGIMVRKNAASNAPFVAFELKGQALSLITRAKDNLATKTWQIGEVSLPCYLKLEKQGEKIQAYTSKDGVTFEKKGEASIGLDNYLTGFYAYGGTAKAKFQQSFLRNEQIDRIALELPLSGEIKAPIEIKAKSGDKVLYIGDLDIQITPNAPLTLDGSLIVEKAGKYEVRASYKDKTAVSHIEIKKPDPLIFQENFDNLPLGSTEPAGFKYNNPAIKIEKEGSGNALFVQSDGAGKSCDVQIATKEKSGIATFEFDYKAVFGKNENQGGSRVIYIGGNNMAVCITASPAGFDYFYGATAKRIAPIEQNKWYKIKVTANFKTKTADVYIDGIKVVEDGEFRNPVDYFSGIWIGGFRVNEDTMYAWDNIKIYSEDEA